ncbi:hypothetical protein SGPA1_20289 [Streptomyces misionensis JCM 4497]
MTVRRTPRPAERSPSHRHKGVTRRLPRVTAGKPVSTLRKTSVNRRYPMCVRAGPASNVLTCTDSYRSLGIGGPVVPLPPHQGSARTDHAPDVPPPGGGRGAHSGGRPGDSGRKSPHLHRLDRAAAGHEASGVLHRQGRVRHRQGRQGPADGVVLHRRRHDPGGPRRRERRCGRADDRTADPGGGEDLRHLPRGHPLPRRPPLPGTHRHRPSDPDDRRAGGAVRHDRHRQAPAGRQRHPAPRQGDRALRRADGVLPLRRHGPRPLCAARRDRLRDGRGHAAVRAGVRGHVRHQGEGRLRHPDGRTRRAFVRLPV